MSLSDPVLNVSADDLSLSVGTVVSVSGNGPYVFEVTGLSGPVTATLDGDITDATGIDLPAYQWQFAICTPDSDGDGVGDCGDACPNTIPGASVDLRGCPHGDSSSSPHPAKNVCEDGRARSEPPKVAQICRSWLQNMADLGRHGDLGTALPTGRVGLPTYCTVPIVAPPTARSRWGTRPIGVICVSCGPPPREEFRPPPPRHGAPRVAASQPSSSVEKCFSTSARRTVTGPFLQGVSIEVVAVILKLPFLGVPKEIDVRLAAMRTAQRISMTEFPTAFLASRKPALKATHRSRIGHPKYGRRIIEITAGD